MKEIRESTIRDIQNQKKVDFEIPRLLKLKFKQEGVKLKKYFYNIFQETKTQEFDIDLPEFSSKANKVIGMAEKFSNELSETEKKLFDAWKKISEKLDKEAELREADKEQRTVGQRVGAYYIAITELNKIEDNINEYDELIDGAMRQINILEVEIEAFTELFEKSPEDFKKKIQNAKRSMKKKLRLILDMKKEIKKLDKLGEGWKKSIENIKASTRRREE